MSMGKKLTLYNQHKNSILEAVFEKSPWYQLVIPISQKKKMRSEQKVQNNLTF